MQQHHRTPKAPRAAESAYLATRQAEAAKNRKLTAEANAREIRPGRSTGEKKARSKRAKAEQAATLELANLLR